MCRNSSGLLAQPHSFRSRRVASVFDPVPSQETRLCYFGVMYRSLRCMNFVAAAWILS